MNVNFEYMKHFNFKITNLPLVNWIINTQIVKSTSFLNILPNFTVYIN